MDNTQQTICNTNTKRGFTLIETLVAITILVVAVSTPISLAAQSLFTAFYAKDQTTAFYLAQEGIEMIKNRRDQNLLVVVNGGSSAWLDGISLDTDLHVDTPNNAIYTTATCPKECPTLVYDGVFYNHTNGTPSRFSRTVRVTQDTADADEALVESTVDWKTGSFQERTFTISERIYNWVPQQTLSFSSPSSDSPSSDSSNEDSTPAPTATECSDGIDNDNNGYIDMEDIGCVSPLDTVERGSAGSIICTELYQQGLMDESVYQADEAFGRSLSPVTLRGYHIWARPIVSLMQKSSAFTSFVHTIATPWAHEMAYQMGARDKGSFVGKVLMIIGLPVSWLVGAFDISFEYIIDNGHTLSLAVFEYLYE